MKKRRVLALLPESAKIPSSLDGLSETEIAEWKMEYDVLTALEHLGHTVETIHVHWELAPIRERVEAFKPHIVFNMLEEFAGHVAFDQNVVAWLELIGVPYTGCNPRGLVLARDKALAKKIMEYHRIRTPRFAVFPRTRKVIRKPKRLEYPLFVKSLVEDASIGISQASIVRNDEQLEARVRMYHEQHGSSALVEEYIEGREFYLALLGNKRIEAFPLWELVMDNLPEGTARVATERIKFDIAYQEKYGITTREARDVPDAVLARLHRTGRRIMRLLGMTGYARIDLRYREEDGALFVLEANPNPDLSSDEDYALSCDRGGLPYEQLISRILSLGMRYEPGHI